MRVVVIAEVSGVPAARLFISISNTLSAVARTSNTLLPSSKQTSAAHEQCLEQLCQRRKGSRAGFKNKWKTMREDSSQRRR